MKKGKKLIIMIAIASLIITSIPISKAFISKNALKTQSDMEMTKSGEFVPTITNMAAGMGYQSHVLMENNSAELADKLDNEEANETTGTDAVASESVFIEEAATDSSDGSELETEPELETASEQVKEPETEKEVESETETEIEGEKSTETETELETVVETEEKSETESASEKESETETESETASETTSEIISETEEEIISEEESEITFEYEECDGERIVSEEYCVTSFMEMEDISVSVKMGTKIKDIELPKTIRANITKKITKETYKYILDEDFQEKIVRNSEQEDTYTELAIKTFRLEWSCEDYDAKTTGKYTFTAKPDTSNDDDIEYSFEDGVLDSIPKGTVTVFGKGSFTLTSDEGVVVTADSEEILSYDTVLDVSANEESNATILNLISQESALTDKNIGYVSLDISLEENEKEVQPNGTVEVAIPIPEQMSENGAAVYHRLEDGSFEKMNGKVDENGYFVFNTTHFSDYILIGENIAELGEDPAEVQYSLFTYEDTKEITSTNLIYTSGADLEKSKKNITIKSGRTDKANTTETVEMDLSAADKVTVNVEPATPKLFDVQVVLPTDAQAKKDTFNITLVPVTNPPSDTKEGVASAYKITISAPIKDQTNKNVELKDALTVNYTYYSKPNIKLKTNSGIAIEEKANPNIGEANYNLCILDTDKNVTITPYLENTNINNLSEYKWTSSVVGDNEITGEWTASKVKNVGSNATWTCTYKSSTGATGSITMAVKYVHNITNLSFTGADISNNVISDFKTMSEGFNTTTASNMLNTKKITITNKHTEAIKLEPSCSNDIFDYTFSDGKTTYELPVNGKVDLTISLKSGVKEGTYTNQHIYLQKKDSKPIVDTGMYLCASAAICKKVTVEDKNSTIKIVEGNNTTLSPVITNTCTPKHTLKYQWYTQTYLTDVKTRAAIKDETKDTYNYIAKKGDSKYIVFEVTDEWGTIAELTYTVNMTELNYSIDFSPKSIDFGNMIETYATPPTSKTVTLSNKSSVGYSAYDVTPAKYFKVEVTTKTNKIAKGGTLNMTVQPNIGLAAGTYNEKVRITCERENGTGEDVAEFSCQFTVIKKDESISVSPSSIVFEKSTVGYTKLPTARTVTVTNKGNTSVTVRRPTSSYYTLSGFSADKVLSKGQSFSFSIQPTKGLSSGDNKESILIGTDTAQTSLVASFNVVDEPKIEISGELEIEESMSTTLTAKVTGGITPYTYKWSNNETKKEIKVTPKEDTEYTLTVTDATGASVKETVMVKVDKKLAVTITGPNMLNMEYPGTLVANVTNGKMPYEINWSNGKTGDSIDINPKQETTYTVEVKDANGVKVTASKTVKVMGAIKTNDEIVYTLRADKNDIDFGEVEEGYDVDSLKQTLVVTNKSEEPVTLKIPVSNKFVFEGMDEDRKLSPEESVTFQVYPREYLGEGEYKDIVILKTAQKAYENVNLSFVVTPAHVVVDELPQDELYESADYGYGKGNISLELENGNSDLLGIANIENCIQSVFTSEELDKVSKGNNVSIKITVNKNADQISEQDKQLIDSAINHFKTNYKTLTLGMIMDITVSKNVDNNSDDWVEVSETRKNIEMVLNVPYELRTKGSDFYLLRNHGGNCAQIAQWNRNGGKWVFNSNQFSTYAIAYIPSDKAYGSSIFDEDGNIIELDSDGNPIDDDISDYDYYEDEDGLRMCGWGIAMIIIILAYEIVLLLKQRVIPDKVKLIASGIVMLVLAILSIFGHDKIDILLLIIGCVVIISTVAIGLVLNNDIT